MSNQLPLTIQMGSLPPAVLSTPQQLADMIAARLKIVTQGTFALFVAGSTAPVSDVGPWWKDNESWYYWDVVSGSYQPQIIAPASLGYTIGSNPPNSAIYQIWIETNVSGSPLAVKTYYSGSWVDVYAATLSNYSTTTQMNAAISVAVAAAVAASTSPTYPAMGSNAAVPQSIPTTGVEQKITIVAAFINPSPSPLSTATSRYTAPASGTYLVTVTSQFDNSTGAPATMQVLFILKKNGVSTGLGGADATPSPVGSRWYPGFSVLVSLASADYLELYAEVVDTPGTGLISLTTYSFNVVRVSNL